MGERIPPKPNPSRELNPDWEIDTEKMLANQPKTREKIDAFDRQMRKDKRVPSEVWQKRFGPGSNG